jgi:CubicO group peptidase (beta-lactamase class C family)
VAALMPLAGRLKSRASIVVAVALSACAAPQADRSSADVAELRSKLEADTKADRFAGAALLARLEQGTPRVLFRDAYGLADREKAIANRVDTRFRIGSMNKMFTATAILRLVQAGRIALTDTVGRHIPDYPNAAIAQKVTIHQLLTHTGGTGDIFGPEYDANHRRMATHDDWLRLYGQRDPLFEPGARFSYSNFGMVILGVVIERVSGSSYYDYVSEHIYRPAGMTQSGLPPEDIADDVRAVGYSRRNGGTRWTATSIVGNRGISAGGGYSTVDDLLHFAAALISNKLLDAEHTRLLIAGKVDSGRGPQYAYGFMDARTNGGGWVGHGGGAPGMNGDLRIYPDNGYVIAVLSNLDPPAASDISAFMHERVVKMRLVEARGGVR